MVLRLIAPGLAIAVISCGRIGFDAIGDTASSDGTVEVPADLANLPCEIDYATLGMLPTSDQIRVAYSAGIPYSVHVHHLSDTLHEVHPHRLTMRGDTLVRTDLGAIYTMTDISGLGVEPDGTDQILVLSDAIGASTHVLRFDDNYVLRGDATVADFHYGDPPYAESSAGRMVVGLTSTGILQVRALDASFAASGLTTTLANPANDPGITPAGADFLVSWTAAGACHFAKVNASGSVVAGPITVVTPTSCAYPTAALLSTGRVAYTLHDVIASTDYRAYGGTIDATLTTATAPVVLGGLPSATFQLVVNGDHARTAVADNTTVQIVDIASAGTITTVGASFGTVRTYEALRIEQVAGASVLFRVENKQLVVRKLCR